MKKYFLIGSLLFLTPFSALAWTKDYGPYFMVNNLQVNDYGVNFIAENKNTDVGFNYMVNIKGKDYGPYDTNKPILKIVNDKWGFSYDDSITRKNRGYVMNGQIISNQYGVGGNDYTNNIFDLSAKSFMATTLTKDKAVDSRNETFFIYQLMRNQKMIAKYGQDNLITQLVSRDTAYAYSLINTATQLTTVYVGSKKYGPYKDVKNLQLSANDKKFGFAYKDTDNKFYANINGKKFGPYLSSRNDLETDKMKNLELSDTIQDLQITNANYGYIYENKQKVYANINGKIYGPFDRSTSDLHAESYPLLTITDKNWGLAYYKDDKNGGTRTFIVNGKTLSSYNPIDIKAGISEGGRSYNYELEYVSDDLVAYSKSSGGKYLLYVNGKKFGPYSSTYGFATDKKNWAMLINENDKYSVVVNGKVVYRIPDNLRTLDKARRERTSIGDRVLTLSGNNWGYYEVASFCEEEDLGPDDCMGKGNCVGCSYTNRPQEALAILSANGKINTKLVPIVDFRDPYADNPDLRQKFTQSVDPATLFDLSGKYWAYQYVKNDQVYLKVGSIDSWQ